MVKELGNNIFLGITEIPNYNGMNRFFSPSEHYSESLFQEEELSRSNEIYKLVREGFVKLGYDLENFNSNKWNPLSSLVKKGDTVLIKPNWVMHKNKNKNNPDNLECLVTHPSIVRAIIDFTLIALKGTGKVIIADAPMQGCDLFILLKKTGYDDLFEFYRTQGIEIEILDLRAERVITKSRVITESIEVNNDDQSVCIDLGELSKHIDIGKRYKVSDYSASKTNKYHDQNKHVYNISRKAIDADVIINLPKPKCHRLAGITAAQKNLVGIIFDKSSLPHRSIGSKEEKGDEYPSKSILKSMYASIEEKKLLLTEKKKPALAFLLQLFIVFIYFWIKFFSKDKVMIGSWYGNDTIWRTVSDLNLIVKYADKNGIIQETPQRKIFNVADMIIAGQGNGPIGPHPKNLGIILMGEDPVLMDMTCAKIMWFAIEKIPGLETANQNSKQSLDGEKVVLSNISDYNNIQFDAFAGKIDWKFDPHDFWKGHIEA